MSKKRLKRPRAKHYTQKAIDVLLSLWARELKETPKPNGDDLTENEIKEEIIRRLHALAYNMGRMAQRGCVRGVERREALYAARLILSPRKPRTFAAAQEKLLYEAGHLSTMSTTTWHERLNALLEIWEEVDPDLAAALRSYIDAHREKWREEGSEAPLESFRFRLKRIRHCADSWRTRLV